LSAAREPGGEHLSAAQKRDCKCIKKFAFEKHGTDANTSAVYVAGRIARIEAQLGYGCS
jgi:hypothetical protein